ncbi:MAG: zinc ribbon domain-containing protein [Caldilineaceae bacterium]|nr:zinc ribbon domain-containing protein [Caldilineaceae bacterium]
MASVECPHCGTPNRAGSNFCNRCGTDLRGEVHDSLPEGETAPELPEEQGPGSPAPPPSPGADQPWLQPDFLGEDDVPFEPEDDEDLDWEQMAELPSPAARLISGVQGLLEPIRVATTPPEGLPETPLPPVAGLNVDQLRRVRALMAEEPVVASAPARRLPRQPSLWLPWIFLLVGVAVALPVVFGPARTAGEAYSWPGVAPAFQIIDQLQPETPVLIFWAYDPATAGEMDVVAYPVIAHLLDRGVRPAVFSLLPNGPASARRLFLQVQTDRETRAALDSLRPPVSTRYLPGGVTVMPMLAREPAALAVVIAAQTHDVQVWLEQVAPLHGVPVVAATAAGAEPLLRPYLESGQLAGSVTGFDGAAHYSGMGGTTLAISYTDRLRTQFAGQNFGGAALILVIVLGNLAAFVVGRRQDG